MPILTTEERLGSKLANKYRLDSVLGKGGFGVVFAGVHEWTGREIAAKVLNHDLAEEQQFVRRFLQEARSAASIKHPNVVDVLDMGEDTDGTVYLVLELLKGEDLKRRLAREKVLTEEVALEILVPVMDALAKAHDQGIVHRDLKPDNIYLSVDDKGHLVPKLLDFGIAKTSDSGATHTGQVIGTPHYMSPEQARGSAKVGPEADVWSMGVVFWKCLTGTLPFDADSPTGVLAELLTRRASPIRRVKPSLHRPISAVIDRALTWEREKRYPDMRAFLAALQEAARQPRDAGGHTADITGPLQALPPPLYEDLDTSTPRPGFGETRAPSTPRSVTGPLRDASTGPQLRSWATPEPPRPRGNEEVTPVAGRPTPQPTPAKSRLPVAVAIGALALVGAGVLSLVWFWPGDPEPVVAVATESAPVEPVEPPPVEDEAIAEPTAPVIEGPSASDRARECSAEGDHGCVVAALEGHAASAVDLVLLIESYRALGNAREAERHTRAFVERFPNTPRAGVYRQIQEQAARARSRPRRTARRQQPSAPSAPAAPTPSAPAAPRVGANSAPILR